MSTSTNTFLEFNRDLFLCNTIHDPQNVDGVIPTITEGNLYKKKRTVDPFDNIYVLPKDYFNDKEAYNNGIIHNKEPITTIFSEAHPDYVKGMYWLGCKIEYNQYIQNLDTYLNGNMDIWVGSGRVTLTVTDPRPPTVTTTYTFSVEGGSLVKLDRNFVGSCDNYNLKTICPREDPQKWENCEICKNFKYRDWYDKNNPTQINLNARYDDASSEYHHMWLQTWNLGIGIIALAYGIYYQLS